MESASSTGPSDRQWLKLLNVVATDSELKTGQFTGPNGKVRVERKWNELSVVLNAIPGPGAKKTGRLWKEAYTNLKSRARKAYHDRMAYVKGTGGGPPPDPDTLGLSDVYKKCLSIICMVTTVGNVSVPCALEYLRQEDHNRQDPDDPRSGDDYTNSGRYDAQHQRGNNRYLSPQARRDVSYARGRAERSPPVAAVSSPSYQNYGNGGQRYGGPRFSPYTQRSPAPWGAQAPQHSTSSHPPPQRFSPRPHRSLAPGSPATPRRSLFPMDGISPLGKLLLELWEMSQFAREKRASSSEQFASEYRC